MDTPKELQVKHLAPYLPYNLKFQWVNEWGEPPFNIETQELLDLSNRGKNWYGGVNPSCLMSFNIQEIKPLLIPLSHAKSGFELNGKIYRHYYDWLTASEREVFDRHYSHYTYRMIEEFSKYHIDWQKLIERGLAVNKLEFIK